MQVRGEQPAGQARRAARGEGAVDDVQVDVYIDRPRTASRAARRARAVTTVSMPWRRTSSSVVDVDALLLRPAGVLAGVAEGVDAHLGHAVAAQAALDELANRRAVGRARW